ncbi:hypothetical protein [Sorangium atrum]|uniref:Uncharacterized protein n=1 Tax=Sorangium atrum TaxID=2995308 RepID=A0ABT5C3H4_9BACT|nr:hypothetical protein [Sorangium aterium]MDC0680955.1 hypothetical protein [Sorangium aterium]
MGSATSSAAATTNTARLSSVTWFGVIEVRASSATTPPASGRIRYVLKS